ncbi:T9SS type A sorting domain-containing protein [Tamlana haliotis]|uniref:T9SS type A sorting domain-containing protein n=1 Tax=Pseudotamlana haliotis TaxID=2614804 RepID=A0A6N6MG07_9FLAO|nr:T9SS type A sorting domain-containing protein [Tamlana haliotis]KAB1067725.1 T9SS type A sorting domain-containing protein [Tamlana haliotis]
MKKIYKNILLAFIAVATTGLSYGQNFATYSNTAVAGNFGGTLGSVGFTLTIAPEHTPKVGTANMEGNSYASYEGSWATPAIKMKPVDNFTCTITFDQAIPNLKFYIADWVFSTIEYNHDFTILSNYEITAANENTLNVTVSDGIIEFTEPVTTLTFTRTSGTNSGNWGFALLDGPTLGVNDVYAKGALKLYPSPSSDFIAISGLTAKENYTIYNTVGAVVGSGEISANEKIGVSHLTNGIYVLRLEKGNAIKFVKK